MDQRGRKSPSGPGHEGALCALHRAGDIGSCGVDNVEGFTVFVRNSLVVNKQAVAAVGKVIRMGIAGIFHGATSWGF